MATFNEIAYNILNIARGGISSDDDRLNVRQIKFWVEYYRARTIFEFTNAGRDIDPQLVQDLGCLKLQEVDKAECNDITWEENIKKVGIPQIVSLPDDKGVISIRYIDKQKPIILTSSDVVHWDQFRFITNHEPRAYFIDNALYIQNPQQDDLCFVNVRGIFEQPSKVETKDSSGNTVCFDDEVDEYPLPMKLVNIVTEHIMSKELPRLVGSVNDELNSAREEKAQVVSEAEKKPLG